MHSTLDMASGKQLSHGRKIAGGAEDVAALWRLHFLAALCLYRFQCILNTKRLICVGVKSTTEHYLT
jgi:hypothetical protein